MRRFRPSTIRFALATASVCALAAWATSAAAQSVPPGALTGLPPADSKLFELDVTGRVVYDSNITGGRAVVADAKDLHQDDIIYTPTARANFYLPVGRQSVFLDASVGYDDHQYNSMLNHANITLNGGVVASLGRSGGDIADVYSEVQSNEADLPLQVTRNIQTIQSIGIQVNCSTGVGLGEFLTVRHTAIDNSAQTSVIDSKAWSASAGLSYQRPVLGAISVFAAYSSIDYSNSGPTSLPTPGYQTYSLGLTYARRIGARLKGSMELSLQDIRPGDPPTAIFPPGALPIATRSSLVSVSAQGQLDYAVNSRLKASLTLQRNVQPSIQEGADYTVVELAQLEGTYTLSSRLSASLGASWRNLDYRGVAPATVTALDLVTQDEITGVFGSVSYHLGRKGTLTLDVRHNIRNTNITIFDYTETRVGITATEAF